MIAIAVEAYFKPQRPICPIARLAQQATCFRKPLLTRPEAPVGAVASLPRQTCGHHAPGRGIADGKQPVGDRLPLDDQIERERSEEHTSELQSLMRISYAVFCLTKKKQTTTKHNN